MESVTLGDWVALYAASLSTCLVLASLVKWLMNGPKLSVTVFNPDEIDFQNNRVFLSVISNSGTVSTVVRKLEVSFRTNRWPWGQEIGHAEFGEKSNWKPGVRLVPTDRPNTSRPEPNILPPGAELRAPAQAISEYDRTKHWICVTAFARNRRRGFTAWASPSLANSEDKGGAS